MRKYLSKVMKFIDGISLALVFFTCGMIALFCDNYLKAFLLTICGSICYTGEIISKAIKEKEVVEFNLQNPTVISERN